jgi:hypothetical protein
MQELLYRIAVVLSSPFWKFVALFPAGAFFAADA